MSIDRAATLRNAEQLLRQGQLDAAIAEYVQVVEAFPRDWTTANVLGDAYARAGQIEKAVEQFIRIADGLSHEGFLQKAGALYKKTLKLKPEAEQVLWKAAETAAKQGLFVDARAFLTTIEQKRRQAGDEQGAGAARIRIGTLDPANYAARRAAAVERGGLGDVAGAVKDLTTIADELRDLERFSDASEALEEAARLAPDANDIRTRLFEAHLVRGQVERARELASSPDQLRRLADALEQSGRTDEALEIRGEAVRLDPSSDPAARLGLVAAEIRRGRGDDAAAIVLELLQADPSLRPQILVAALNAAPDSTEAAFRSALLVADSHVVEGEWSVAADAMEAFAQQVPLHLPARERLAEICVDGMLEGRLVDALAQLTDAYLNAGLGEQARAAAEDLVARAPWDRANFDRFRQALVLLQASDPDAIIAERLSGESPFVSTALDPRDESRTSDDAGAVQSTDQVPRSNTPAPGRTVSAPMVAESARDLEDVFVQFRGEASRKTKQEAAEADYRRALELKEAGDLDGCVEVLLAASRAPSLRFVAGSLLARVYKQRGQITDALDWFERAAQAPAPSPAEYHEVLFELVEGLEASGNVTRALAIGLELQADAGAYRDVAERVDRLARAQARG